MEKRHHIKSVYRPALAGIGLAVASVLLALSAPLGSRSGFWSYDMAVTLLKTAALGFVIASVLCLLGLAVIHRDKARRGLFPGLAGLLVAVPTLLFLYSWHSAKTRLPPIQDITTDTANPPEFWTAPNSRVYGGEAVAALQRKAYPDIEPLILDIAPDAVYDRAVEIMRTRKWKIWETDREEKHIEATETTFWFGFSDDVVIHVRETDTGGSRVDMRSASRSGSGGDSGTNAKRIRAFFQALKQRFPETGPSDRPRTENARADRRATPT